MDDLERKIKQAENTIFALNQQIDGLTAKRSRLQNEIEEREKSSLAKIEGQKKTIQDDLDRQYAELKEAKKKFEDYKNDVDKDLSLRTKEVIQEEEENSNLSADLAKQKSELEAYKSQISKDLADKNSALSQANQKLTDRQKELDKLSEKLLALSQNIENKNNQLDYKQDQLIKQEDSLSEQQALFNKTLENISKEKELVAIERTKLAESLVAINKATEDNNKLLNSIAESTNKNNDILAKIEKEREIQINEARILSAQKDSQDERERALNERQRLMDIKNRDIDSKTVVLRQLRDEIKKLDKPDA